ncbi:MAG: hypothetical protein ACOC4B_01630 [Bacteroidota bacterium]
MVSVLKIGYYIVLLSIYVFHYISLFKKSQLDQEIFKTKTDRNTAGKKKKERKNKKQKTKRKREGAGKENQSPRLTVVDKVNKNASLTAI